MDFEHALWKSHVNENHSYYELNNSYVSAIRIASYSATNQLAILSKQYHASPHKLSSIYKETEVEDL